MQKVIRPFRVLNTLSIDVAIGAMAGALFFANILGVELRVAGVCSLGLTVWIIYTIDHLMDALFIQGVASSERHQFHQRNFRLMATLVVVAICVDLSLLFFIRKTVFISGVVLFMAVCIYMLIHRRIVYFKELLVATMYTLGVLLPSLSINEGPISWKMSLLFLQFGITAFINLLLFSQFEKESDLRDHQESLVTRIGEVHSLRMLWFLFLVQFFVAVLLFSIPEFRSIELILVCMNAILAVIRLFPSVFAGGGYRLAGDGIFLLPLVYLLIK